MKVDDGRQRVVIEGVSPEIDGGRFPIKRVPGEQVVVEADIFTDGHDSVSAVLLFRRQDDAGWHEVPFEPIVNDRWTAAFTVSELGRYTYTIHAWVDHFKTWALDLDKRLDAGQDVSVERVIGAQLVEAAVSRASGADAKRLREFAVALRDAGQDIETVVTPELRELMSRYPNREFATEYGRELSVTVDPVRARFSAWYEAFPRSLAPEPGAHGTFKDVEAFLPRLETMGFDVLYLPPIHPIGSTFRKGKNNTVTPEPDDTGSPWAIGSEEGGHKSIHPELGTVEDFRSLVKAARQHGVEVAMDIAFQCSPDHPYVTEHPEWFRKRPDGTIQYAENPPKKYQDIYPFDFETPQWRELWTELKSIFEYWMEQGVRVFRVDNPHTKPLLFWEWLIGDIKQKYPETIFLSEAFTRPKLMYRLAKLGFTQSYNYFAWRNTSWELTEYFTELTQTQVKEYFRPNVWPNTPDILTEYLQIGGRSPFLIRLFLAATLGASYGIYGPAFELMENEPLIPGREEYLDSEKYQIREWDRDSVDSLEPIITQINRIRRENPALQRNDTLQFHPIDNDQMLAYSKTSVDGLNTILVVVNLDPHYTHAGWLNLDLDALGVEPDQTFQVHDLVGGGRYLWHDARNYVELNPHAMPGHIFRLRHRVSREQDFDYFA